jgi:hypothetical protein
MAPAVDAPELEHADTAEPTRPVIAHMPREGDEYVALCGTPLRGQSAPRGTERCVVCADLLLDHLAAG